VKHSSDSEPSTRPEDRVPVKRKLAWSVGAIFENMMSNGVGVLVTPIFNIGYGIPAIWLGWGGMIPRLIDAVADPILGWLSDNTRTRWGRRRPWMFIGGVLGSFFFTLIWFADPNWSKEMIFAWFLVISIFYYLSYGIFAISYNALGMELSPDYQERTRVQAWRFVFINISSQFLNWAYKLSLIPLFAIGMPAAFGRPEVYGMRGVGVIFGVLMFLCAMVPVCFVKEPPLPIENKPNAARREAQPKLTGAMRETFSNRIYLHFMLILVVGILGAFVLPFQTYLNIFYVFGGDKAAAATLIGINSTVGMIFGFGIAPLVSWLSSKIGKKGTLLLGQIIMVPGALISYFLYNPQYPYLQLAIWVLFALGLPAILVLYNSVVADIADLDELKTGLRREGMYGAVTAFILKVLFAATTVIMGYTLAAVGFREDLATQTEHTLGLMHVWIAVWPAVMAGITAILLFFFPLTRAKAGQVRRILEKRRGRRLAVA
jgi:GPH family glycoside/pentoside/hexuronide:cation symporter